MEYPKCDRECEMSDDILNKNICCYWCSLKSGCGNLCKDLDCRTVKIIELEDGEL